MMLELAVTLFGIAFFFVLLSGLFIARMVLKDGIRWKDPIVISSGVALLIAMLGAIVVSTYFILEMV